MDNKQIIKILIDKVAKLESKNKDLESEIKYLKAENEKIKINLSAINEFINEKKEKQRIKNLPFNDSSILLKKEEIKIVSDWIKPNTKIKQNFYIEFQEMEMAFLEHVVLIKVL